MKISQLLHLLEMFMVFIKPGNVVLSPKILDNSQKYIQEKLGTSAKPVDFVFHGGSGSLLSEIRSYWVWCY